MTTAPAPVLRIRLALILGIFGISCAGVLIRRLGELGVGELTVAGVRMLYSTVLLLPALWPARHGLASALRRHPGILSASSLLLALHFGAFTASLYHSEVARAVVLASLHPLFVAAGARLWYGERLSPIGVASVVVALGGVVAMVGDDVDGTHVGDLLSLLAAVSFAGYVLLGRRARHTLDLTHYAAPLYALTGALLVTGAFIRGESLADATAEAHLLILGLAILPTLLGHMLFSWALRWIPPTIVSVAFLGESVGGALLAWGLLNEVPSGRTVFGGLLCLAGITGVVLGHRRQQAT